MLSGFGRIPGKRALVAAAGIVGLAAGAFGFVAAGTPAAYANDFKGVACTANITGDLNIPNQSTSQDFTINVSAPTEANSGQDFTITT